MLCANPQSQFCKQLGLPTYDPYFSQIPLFNGLSILLIIPKRESLVGHNLSVLILCSRGPNQELPLSQLEHVIVTLEPATTDGEDTASWPPGVAVSGFILYSSSFLTQCLVWFGLPGQTETPAQKVSSSMHCVVWLSCLLFRSDTQIACVVKSLSYGPRAWFKGILKKRKKFTISQV